MASNNSQKIPEKYDCSFCNYITVSKKDFNKHILSNKHARLVNASKMLVNPNELSSNDKKMYFCNCGKTYSHDSSYYRHKKKCNITIVTDSNAESFDKDKLIIMLINQNAELIKETSEFKTMMMKVIENGTMNHSHNTTNSHNKAFNLNFFLNETCKDAMNIMDFVDSIKLQLSDLEGVGELGYVEGISKIIVKNLKELDVTQRPVHCTDKKRETMYIKDHDKWEKDEERLKLHKVVRKVACKNQNLIPKFKEIHPDCGKYHSKFSDQYNKIIVESMGGSGDNDFEKEEKIIKNISKQVFIDKEESV
jgi:hypothetical protein